MSQVNLYCVSSSSSSTFLSSYSSHFPFLNMEFRPPNIPERVSSLMPLERQRAIQSTSQRTASATSQLSNLSIESSASDFLDAKIDEMETELDYIRCVREGYKEATESNALMSSEIREGLKPFLRSFRSSSQMLQVVKRQRLLIVEDLDDELENKRQRTCEPNDHSLLERAYKDVIVPRVMGATGRQKTVRFDQSAFKKDVYEYYGLKEHCPADHGYCHVLKKILPSPLIKTAHLVPKSMTQKEISYLFGLEEAVLSEPRNGKKFPLL
jgi:hypothetical protein